MKRHAIFSILNRFFLALLVACHLNIYTTDQISELLGISQNYSDIALFDPNILVCQPAKSSASSKGTSYSHSQPLKDWTIVVELAADNDLRFFATNNIKQMAEQGSNGTINILAELHIRLTGNQKVTRRYYIEKNKVIHVNAYDTLTQKMDSGDPQTLISCLKWATENYPAHNYALILWNHGTGIIDPKSSKTINPADLFIFNPLIKKLELNRSIGFLDLLNTKREQRGICWDNSTGNYLTNEKLSFALHEIKTKILNGKKLSIIGFDACLMSMLEVASLIKDYAHVMVGSQELELGWGWNYSQVLAPFAHRSFDNVSFGKHIVDSYEFAYKSITDDYTQSALNLDRLPELEIKINQIAELLILGMQFQDLNTVTNAIKTSRNKHNCTQLDEQRYIDLHDYLCNLETRVSQFKFKNMRHEKIIPHLLLLLNDAKLLIKQIAFANTVGTNLSRAHGISIYFPDHPERTLDSSYLRTTFAQQNKWAIFLNHYLSI